MDANGQAWVWGYNGDKKSGASQDSEKILTPSPVIGEHKANQISPGNPFSAILDTNGDAWAWGDNSKGILGIGRINQQNFYFDTITIPTRIAGNHKFTQIALGDYLGAAIDDNGDTWTWGVNGYGQLGIGIEDRDYISPAPVKVAGGHKFTQISTSGYHVTAIDTNGDAWAWGCNFYGLLGDGTTEERHAPVKVTGGHKFTQISVSEYHTVALDTEGNAWAWGSNSDRQLGDGTEYFRLVPTKVAGGHKFKQISASRRYTVAIDTDGYAWAWGYNDQGSLGIGTNSNSSVPIRVVGGHKFTQISAGSDYTVALDANGQVWAWGYNSQGQFGNGTTDKYPILTPVKVS